MEQIAARISESGLVYKITFNKSRLNPNIEEILNIYKALLKNHWIEIKRIFYIPRTVPLHQTMNIVYPTVDIMRLKQGEYKK